MDESFLRLFAKPADPPSRDETRTPEPEPDARAAAILAGIWKLRENYAQHLRNLEELEGVMLLQFQGIDVKDIDRLLPWDHKQHTPGRLLAILKDHPAIYGVPRDEDGKPADFVVGRVIRQYFHDNPAHWHTHVAPPLCNAVRLKDGTEVKLKYPVALSSGKRRPK